MSITSLSQHLSVVINEAKNPDFFFVLILLQVSVFVTHFPLPVCLPKDLSFACSTTPGQSNEKQDIRIQAMMQYTLLPLLATSALFALSTASPIASPQVR